MASNLFQLADKAGLAVKNNPGPSLAEVMEFEALPEETRALAIKVILGGGLEGVPSRGLLEEAYTEGYEDGVEECEIQRPWVSPDQASRRVGDLLKRRGAT